MQEEIEHKTVNFAISTTKLSARTLLRGMQFLLRQYDKHASQGKQSMKRLVRQNRGVTNVEIQKTGIKDFDRYAKRYHIDYSIQKDLSCKPPRYLVYFKAQDTDALSAAFKEYSASVLDKTKRPSVLAKLHDLAQSVANLPDKVRHKQEERGLSTPVRMGSRGITRYSTSSNSRTVCGGMNLHLMRNWTSCLSLWRSMASGRPFRMLLPQTKP